jgi:hypothetical protein
MLSGVYVLLHALLDLEDLLMIVTSKLYFFCHCITSSEWQLAVCPRSPDTPPDAHGYARFRYRRRWYGSPRLGLQAKLPENLMCSVQPLILLALADEVLKKDFLSDQLKMARKSIDFKGINRSAVRHPF